MNFVPFSLVSALAVQFGAVECYWRESERSFSGFVAEVWFDSLPSDFTRRWAAVVGRSIFVRRVSHGSAHFVVSVPVVVPDGHICLVGGERGGIARTRLVY